jgi:hypothetical protein
MTTNTEMNPLFAFVLLALLLGGFVGIAAAFGVWVFNFL